MERQIRIVLVDDHILIRIALSNLIEQYPELNVVGSVSNGKELLDFLKKNEADIVLLDIEMPVMKGTEVLSLLTERYKKLRVIMLSLHSEIPYVNECIQLGASGYLHKNCTINELYNCILKVFENGFYLNEKTANELLEFSKSARSTDSRNILSEREVEVVKELCTGKSEKEIAGRLNISPNTVHKHRENIYRKTNSHNLADIIFFSIRNGISSVV